MRTWGRQLLVTFGLAQVVTIIAYAAGAGTTVEEWVFFPTWAVLLIAARRWSGLTPQHPSK